jgi:hypothetical protein
MGTKMEGLLWQIGKDQSLKCIPIKNFEIADLRTPFTNHLFCDIWGYQSR